MTAARDMLETLCDPLVTAEAVSQAVSDLATGSGMPAWAIEQGILPEQLLKHALSRMPRGVPLLVDEAIRKHIEISLADWPPVDPDYVVGLVRLAVTLVDPAFLPLFLEIVNKCDAGPASASVGPVYTAMLGTLSPYVSMNWWKAEIKKTPYVYQAYRAFVSREGWAAIALALESMGHSPAPLEIRQLADLIEIAANRHPRTLDDEDAMVEHWVANRGLRRLYGFCESTKATQFLASMDRRENVVRFRECAPQFDADDVIVRVA